MKALFLSFLVVIYSALLGLSHTAWADGELDSGFGTNGVANISFPNSSLGYLYDVAVVNGSIEAAGFERIDPSDLCATPFPNLFVVQLSLGGVVIGSAHSYNQQAVRCPAGLIVDSANGDIYMVGSTGLSVSGLAIVAQFDVSGSLVSVYTDPPQGHYNSTHCIVTKPILDSQDRLVVACMRFGEFGFTELAVRRYPTHASQLTEFFPRLSRVGTTSQYFIRSGNGVAQDASSGAYYVVGVACSVGGGSACLMGSAGSSRAQYVIRLGMNGALDTNYGDGGVAIPLLAADGAAWDIKVDSLGNVLIAGEYGGAGFYQGAGLGYIARINSTGMLDDTFGFSGVVQGLSSPVIEVQEDSSNRVYALEARSGVVRLNHSGQEDQSFASNSQVQALNGPGSAWQSMRFSDSTGSSLYLVGGATGCPGCGNAAVTAVIAKVNLTSGSSLGSTVTALSSSATTITNGQSVTFTATVSGTNPTGTVNFNDGTTALGSPVFLSSGSASFSTSALAVGSHDISATYGGDSNNAASMSSIVTVTVNATSGSGGGGGGGSGGGGTLDWLTDLFLTCLALGSQFRLVPRATLRQGHRWRPLS